ncbi:MAG TPA: BCCT family transporter [Burkholderiales bacterium]|nr:BCCT family transporter [Burkholderiales bacterium]
MTQSADPSESQYTADLNKPVFYISAGFVVVLVLLTALFTERMSALLGALQRGIVEHFGWYYILVVAGFLFFILALLFSRYGSIRLGDDDEEPEYSYPTWFAMMFAAGMGIGLLFYGVAEPILHFIEPLESEPSSVPAAREAMELAYFHWGLHAWGVYIVVGLSMAYFAYRHSLPLTIRSTLYPLLGERAYGGIGNAVEIIALMGTLFGVATSLGLGAAQINSGLAHLNLMPVSTANQLWLIVGIALMATASVASGLDRGIRRLSEANLIMATLLLLFVFLAGPTVFVLSTFVQNLGHYVQTLIEMSFRTTAYRGIEWQASWTMFYWGWWISWSPFVGMFIARISRGRTLREFIAGALFAPTLVGFIWFAVFGNTALHMELFGEGGIAEAVQANVPTALFVMLDKLPFATITTTLATVLVVFFFVTSSDSGSLVMDILAHNGNPNPPVGTRIFWGLSQGVIAAVLLLAGGLAALQTAALASALPFSVVMIFMCISLVMGLQAEALTSHVGPASTRLLPQNGDGSATDDDTPPDWRTQLRQLIGRRPAVRQEESEVTACRDSIRAFIRQADEAFQNLATELARNGRETIIDRHGYQIGMTVLRNGREEFTYTLRGRTSRRAAFAFPQLSHPETRARCQLDIILRGGVVEEARLEDFDQDRIYQHFLTEYAKWVGW